MIVRLLSAVVLCALCATANAAVAQRFHEVDMAMNQWRDPKIRQGLMCVGLIGGSYKVVESGESVIVDAIFHFRNGGKMVYRKRHGKCDGFPGPVALVRLYRYADNCKKRKALQFIE